MSNSHAADAILGDFRNFLYIVWKHLGLPDPTPAQYDMALFLQRAYEGHSQTGKRILIEAFRGVGKSWITSAFVCWVLLKNPQLKILVVSASKERADSFTIFTKRLINEVPMLMHLRGDPSKGHRDSSIAFDVGPSGADHAPSVKSVGITGQITGSRGDIIIADDIETPKNSLTQLQRDRLSELVKEFDSVLKPGGTIAYLGTPQTEMSLYNELPSRGYTPCIWPARYPNQSQIDAYGEKLASWILEQVQKNPALEGKSTDPKRFNDLDLAEREASYGRSGFALQFMLDTSLADSERYPLKLGDMVVMDLDREIAPVKTTWGSAPHQVLEDVPNVGLSGDRIYGPMFVSDSFEEYQGGVLAIDPAGRGGDETGYALVKILHGRLFLLASGGLKGGYSNENLHFLARTCKEFKVTDIVIESNFGDGMFGSLLQPILKQYWPCAIDETRSNQRKELRIIDTLEPVMNQHRLVVDKKVLQKDAEVDVRDYSLGFQLTRLTKDKDSIRHDDRLDALSMAVKFWLDHMSRDEDEAAQEWHDEQFDKMLERFEDHVLGTTPGPDNWTSMW